LQRPGAAAHGLQGALDKHDGITTCQANQLICSQLMWCQLPSCAPRTWNLLLSAGSVSMCCLYSSRVVAPMTPCVHILHMIINLVTRPFFCVQMTTSTSQTATTSLTSMKMTIMTMTPSAGHP
jgi:hypothetical protein